MKRTKLTVAVAAGAALAFGAGHLTAQPPPPNVPPKYALTARQQGFLGDLNAAVNQNNDIKTAKMLADAAGDRELSDVVVEKLWNYESSDNPQVWRRGETLQATLAAQQRQRQIELLEEILAELKKGQRPKE